LAGQETTSVALTWALYELAQRSEIQSKLCTEIQAQKQKHSQGSSHEWTWKDFEDMPYLTAFTKVISQYHTRNQNHDRRPFRKSFVSIPQSH
jgi:cytochrome P450